MTHEPLRFPWKTPLGRRTFVIVPVAEEALSWRESDPARWAAIRPADKLWLACYEGLKANAEQAAQLRRAA
jgi:hypothetical protein